MRLEHLTGEDEDFWRGEFAQQNWIFGALTLSVTLPEFAGGTPALRTMHFGYYLQPLHLNADDREDLPRKLVHVLARRKPPLDFLELSGAGVRILMLTGDYPVTARAIAREVGLSERAEVVTGNQPLHAGRYAEQQACRN